MAVTTSEIVFACHSKACAPPPAGKGGSTPGGKSRRKSKSSGAQKAEKALQKIRTRNAGVDARDRVEPPRGNGYFRGPRS